MGTGKNISDKERLAIAIAFGDNPKEKAQFIQDEASKICGRELSLSTVQRALVPLRKEYPNGMVTDEEAEWNLASLTKYPISSEAIALLLYIKATFHDNMVSGLEDVIDLADTKLFLSIRAARWISRLILIPDDDASQGKNVRESRELPQVSVSKKWPGWLDNIVNIALVYARYEKGCEIQGFTPDTSQLDAPTIAEIELKTARYLRKKYKNKPHLKGDE